MSTARWICGFAVIIFVAAGCGTATSSDAGVLASARPSVSSTQAAELCESLAAVPEVAGEGSTAAQFVVATTTTARAVDAWLAGGAGAGGPSVSLDDYPALADHDDATPVSVCVFRVEPRPISVPATVQTKANGIRLLALDESTYSVDAIGDVERLAKQSASID
jgi:hypothetical protein